MDLGCRSWGLASIIDNYVGGGKATNAFMKALVSSYVREDMPPHLKSTWMRLHIDLDLRQHLKSAGMPSPLWREKEKLVFKTQIFILIRLESFADQDSTLCLEFTLEPFPSPLERETKFASGLAASAF